MTLNNLNVNVHHVILHVKMDVGVKDHIIVRNFLKLIAHLNATKVDALDRIPVNVAIYFVRVDVLDLNNQIAW